MKLMPRPTDLSYFNYATKKASSSPSPQFQIIADSTQGILFKSRRDRRLVKVDPRAVYAPEDCVERVDIVTGEYQQATFYDLYTKKKL